MLLQFRGNKSLPVNQCLFAHIIGGDRWQVGVSDLDIIAEDFIETYFERLDTGALALDSLQRGNPTARFTDRSNQFIQFGMKTGTDQALTVILLVGSVRAG